MFIKITPIEVEGVDEAHIIEAEDIHYRRVIDPDPDEYARLLGEADWTPFPMEDPLSPEFLLLDVYRGNGFSLTIGLKHAVVYILNNQGDTIDKLVS